MKNFKLIAIEILLSFHPFHLHTYITLGITVKFHYPFYTRCPLICQLIIITILILIILSTPSACLLLLSK